MSQLLWRCPTGIASLAVVLVASSWLCAAEPGQPLSLVDGDRVVLLGSTFVERSQAHGYLETALTGRFAGRDIQFRNLGWSGDTVFGEARAGFGTAADGFNHLKEHVAALKPTVILLNYGANESFGGKAGLAGFLAGLDVLLATLDETGARIVFLTPPPQEKLPAPLPDPTEHNRDLKLYSDALLGVAAKRGALAVNLFDLLGKKLLPSSPLPLTDNGIHLTAYGYWRTAPAIEQGLGLEPRRWHIDVDARSQNVSARGTTIRQARFTPQGLGFRAQDDLLPLAPAPPGVPASVSDPLSPRVVRVFNLPAGNYALEVDGHAVTTATAQGWAAGVTLHAGPEVEQAEELRRLIVEKNQLYFHRWRPQNETYLFGFRKHEQGNNAVEIPQFDPLVAAAETKIKSLSVPRERHYQLVKVEAK